MGRLLSNGDPINLLQQNKEPVLSRRMYVSSVAPDLPGTNSKNVVE